MEMTVLIISVVLVFLGIPGVLLFGYRRGQGKSSSGEVYVLILEVFAAAAASGFLLYPKGTVSMFIVLSSDLFFGAGWVFILMKVSDWSEKRAKVNLARKQA